MVGSRRPLHSHPQSWYFCVSKARRISGYTIDDNNGGGILRTYECVCPLCFSADGLRPCVST